jgi:hypothetical protein
MKIKFLVLVGILISVLLSIAIPVKASFINPSGIYQEDRDYTVNITAPTLTKITNNKYEANFSGDKATIGTGSSAFIPNVTMYRFGTDSYIALGEPIINGQVLSGKGLSTSITNSVVEWLSKDLIFKFYNKPIDKQNTFGAFEYEIILANSKAGTDALLGTISFPITSSGLVFYYQTPFTELYQNGWSDQFKCNITVAESLVTNTDTGKIIREYGKDVAGGYSVFYTGVNGLYTNQAEADYYKNGKAFQIYRPYLVDNANNIVYADMTIKNGYLTIDFTSISTWLNKAKYPVVIDPTFGYSGTPSGWSGDTTNVLQSGIYTSANNAANLNNIKWYMKDDLSGLGHTASFKGVMVLISSKNIISGGVGADSGNISSAGWYTSSYSGAPAISASTGYGLSMTQIDNWGGVGADYGMDTGTGTNSYYDSSNSYSSPTNPTDWAGQTYICGVYATYTALAAPDAPTNVSATDGTHTDKVVITWTQSAGADHYKVYRDGGDVSGLLGDVATYDDTGADAPTITAGTATASDGTSTIHVTLSIAGASVSNGTTHSYTVYASNDGGVSWSAASDANTGYCGAGTLTYQWYVSDADSDADYASLGAGANTNPYNDTTAPSGAATVETLAFAGYGADWVILQGKVNTGVGADGRYFYCEVGSADAVSVDTNTNRGYKDVGVTQVGFDYGLTTAYGDDWTTAVILSDGDIYTTTIRGLTSGTVYHFRAKVFSGGWVNGNDNYVGTTGSPVIYEYYNTGGDGDSASIYENNMLAQQFTAGATSHTAIKIKLYIARVGAPGDILVELKHATVADEPTGLNIASGTLNGNIFSTSYLWLTFELDEVSLQSGTKYAIVVSAPDGDVSNYVTVKQDTGGGLADAVGLHSHDAGSTWTSDTPIDYLFEVWGNSCARIITALAYQNYIATGDLIFMLEYINIYPPYYSNPQQDVKQFFTIRFLDLDGTTVLGATPMLQWGDKPASIYLSVAQATSITIGGEYYLEIYGLFTGNPSSMYQLTAADWGGNIEGWVLSTAHNMDLYYGVDMTTFIANKGEVLNDEANAMFTTSIPYLMDMYPNIFATVNKTPGFIAPAVMPANADTWQNIVGADTSNLFNNIGAMFGIDGKYAGTAIIFLIYIMLAGAVVSKGGSPVIGLAVSFPIIAIGLFCLVVDYVIVGAVMVVMAALVLIGMWVTRT